MSENQKPNSCCEMRRKVAVGIAKVYSEGECGLTDAIMLDFHDFDYKSPTKLPVAAALVFKFCPWCGARRVNGTDRRTTEIIRRIGRDDPEDTSNDWKKGGQSDDE